MRRGQLLCPMAGGLPWFMLSAVLAEKRPSSLFRSQEFSNSSYPGLFQLFAAYWTLQIGQDLSPDLGEDADW